MKIKDLSSHYRPRERMEIHGASALSDIELLAIILGGGTIGVSALDLASQMLSKAGSLSSLSTFSLEEFMSFKGIGKAKALHMIALFEVYGRIAKPGQCLPESSDPNTVADFYANHLKSVEEAILLLLSPSKKPVGQRLLYRGDDDSISFSPSEILKTVLTTGYRNFILIHNHPSGVAHPSQGDIRGIAQIDISASKVGLKMIDFIITGDGNYYSFREINEVSADSIYTE